MRRLLLLGLLAFVTVAAALYAGSAELNFREIWGALSGQSRGMAEAVVWELRLPRILSAFAVGGMLALAGALMQVLLVNPLADPYILGVSGGAAVGAMLALAFGAAGWLVTGGALSGALLSMLLVFGLARSSGQFSPSRLLLTGVVVAAGWGALISFLLAVAPQATLRGMLFWLMGDLSASRASGLALMVLAAGLLTTWPLARPLNLLAGGEVQAASLGVAIAPLRLHLYLAASLLTATAVTVAGSVGFVGLVVPHMLRLLLGSDHRLLLPASVLLGGTLLVAADTLARTVVAPQQLPVGVLTAFIGVPAFLYLLRRG